MNRVGSQRYNKKNQSPDIMPSFFTLPQQTFCLNVEVTEGILCFPLNTPGLFETPVNTTVVHCELGVLNGDVAEV
jgi:hypothetical protein